MAVGRAIVRKPKVFLFDEPLSNLDAKLRVQMRAEICQAARTACRRTMIYVTHDQIEAMTMGDRIVVLKDGIIQQVGTPLRCTTSRRTSSWPASSARPAMNFIRGNGGATRAASCSSAGRIQSTGPSTKAKALAATKTKQ